MFLEAGERQADRQTGRETDRQAGRERLYEYTLETGTTVSCVEPFCGSTTELPEPLQSDISVFIVIIVIGEILWKNTD